MDFQNNSIVLFHIARILYPKYHPFWFIFYMYLIYFRIYKRKLKFSLKRVPNKLISYHLKSNKYFSDSNNTVIVNEANIYKYDRLLMLVSEKGSKCRSVYVLPSSTCGRGELLLSEALYYNVQNAGISSPVTLINYREDSKFADEIDVSLVSSPFDIGNSISDGILERFFTTPKLLNKFDLIEINIKHFAEDVFLLNSKLNNMENIYFRCNKITFQKRETDDSYFCVIGETAVKQSVNIQSFLPKKTTKFVNMPKGECLEEISLCPYGLETYIKSMERAVKPFIMNRKLSLKPVFLLQGNIGCGKEILVSTLAAHLGMHFYKINNFELQANVYAQNETKLRNAFFNAKMAAPCIISIHNFENFGKNSEGQYDERLMGCFSDELDILFANNTFPVFLFCCRNRKDIPSELKKLFLETFEISAPTDEEREQDLKWILEDNGVETSANLSDLANKTHGFYFEDLKALVYYALEDRKASNDYGDKITENNFVKAIDLMQSNYNESLGAPKVPKVQWSDVGGLTDVKEEIIKTINLPLKHPEFLKKSGLKRSGILLFGPPGTGKTLIAKAVATECGLCFLSVKGPELLNMYVGQSEQNIREVFQRAREASPCIIFFDELDSLAPNRGLSGDSGGVMDRVVSQLLAEMDGLNDSATVFIIGATNRPDLIDPALLRPGRFDKMLYIGPCTDDVSKTAVLKALTRKFNLGKDVDLAEVVAICPKNLTGADFYGLCSSAWSSAARKLITNIETGQLNIDDVTHEDVTVDLDDFKNALDSVKPSISAEDLNYFEKLKEELSANV